MLARQFQTADRAGRCVGHEGVEDSPDQLAGGIAEELGHAAVDAEDPPVEVEEEIGVGRVFIQVAQGFDFGLEHTKVLR
jgi:hypothetical protein